MDVTSLTEPPVLYILIALAVIVVGLIVWGVVASARRRREREQLQQRYGAEYERTLAQHRSSRAAVEDLKQRERERDLLQMRELNDADRDLVRRHMATAQYRFLEDPADSIAQTQRVVVETLRAKGYPMDINRDEALRLFSVDHPEHVGALRTLLEGRSDGDIAYLRSTFLGARRVLQEVTGTSYTASDVSDRPDDLRVEHDVTPQATAER